MASDENQNQESNISIIYPFIHSLASVILLLFHGIVVFILFCIVLSFLIEYIFRFVFSIENHLAGRDDILYFCLVKKSIFLILSVYHNILYFYFF